MKGSGQSYIAVLRAGDLIDAGIEVKLTPQEESDHGPACPGHCDLPQIRYDNRKDPAVVGLELKLVELAAVIHGPFPRYEGTPLAALGEPWIRRAELANRRLSLDAAVPLKIG